MSNSSSMSYLVALGAPVSLDGLCRAVGAACPDALVRAVQCSQLRAEFPETDSVVVVATPDSAGEALPERANSTRMRLVSHRHTPTSALRRMVQQVARQFGSARLLVRHASDGPQPRLFVPVRCQTTTLSGFLRSGRVVQDDILLTIVPS
jgi:NAD(P)-dependent dehydrogenase (short-subunit alcohol dehydrogenase family)